MFVHVIVRVRGASSTEAGTAAYRFLDTVADANNAFTLLFLCSYAAGVQVLLVDSSDWRRRDREAKELLVELSSREEMVQYAKSIRFGELFMMLGATRSRHELAIYQTLRTEYLETVDSPAKEEVFLRATDHIVREVLTLTMDDAAEYLDERAELSRNLLAHSTGRSFPFVEATGLDLYESRLFDLGGEGDEHYVLASVHV